MNENEISFYIRKSIFEIYNELGPGLLEKVYEKTLAYDLKSKGLEVRTQVPIPIKFKDLIIESSFIADIIVENKVIIEIKSIEEISNVHHKQLLTYLKLTNLKLGILVNFNTDYIDKSIYRKINGYID
jgi:GxxExxY protein